MNNKDLILITTTIIFFLVVNTRYFWEGKLGVLFFPIFIFSIIIFFVLICALIVQIIKGFSERFEQQNRNWIICFMALNLFIVFIKPNGLINFDKLEGEDLLIAQKEGSANCMVTFKMKANFKFRERSVCFGISEVVGNYKIQNDTIFFSNAKSAIKGNEYYEYAVIKKSKRYREGKSIFRYRNVKDTIGSELWLEKNDLLK